MEGPRGTRRKELTKVVELLHLVFRTSGGMPATIPQQYPLLFNAANLDNLRIILDDGKPVSHVGIQEVEAFIYGCRIRVGTIGGVCTHPEYRGRGLATMVLADSMRKMVEDGVDVVLISGIRGLYSRVGCAVAGRVHRFRIMREDAERLPSQSMELLPLNEPHTTDLIEAYQKEPVRFHRTLEDFKVLLQAPCPGPMGATEYTKRNLLVGDGLNFLGYLVVQMPREVHKDEVKASSIIEYGGARRAIAGALKLLLEQYGVKELNFAVPAHDRDLLFILRQAGITIPKTTNFPGTLKLLNLPNLLRNIRPYLEERLGKKTMERFGIEKHDKGFAFHFDHESITIKNEKDLTGLVFGIPDIISPKHEPYLPKIQISRKKGKLPQALQRVFPLPTLLYGLNYW